MTISGYVTDADGSTLEVDMARTHKRPFVGVSGGRPWTFLSTCGENRPRFLKNLSKLASKYPYEGPCVALPCATRCHVYQEPFLFQRAHLKIGVATLFFFLTLVAGPTRSLSLKLSDTRVYEPQIRALAWLGDARGREHAGGGHGSLAACLRRPRREG